MKRIIVECARYLGTGPVYVERPGYVASPDDVFAAVKADEGPDWMIIHRVVGYSLGYMRTRKAAIESGREIAAGDPWHRVKRQKEPCSHTRVPMAWRKRLPAIIRKHDKAQA